MDIHPVVHSITPFNDRGDNFWIDSTLELRFDKDRERESFNTVIIEYILQVSLHKSKRVRGNESQSC